MRHIFELEDRFVEGVHSCCFGGEPEALVTSGVKNVWMLVNSARCSCLRNAYRRSRLVCMSFALWNVVGSSSLQRSVFARSSRLCVSALMVHVL